MLNLHQPGTVRVVWAPSSRRGSCAYARPQAPYIAENLTQWPPHMRQAREEIWKVLWCHVLRVHHRHRTTVIMIIAAVCCHPSSVVEYANANVGLAGLRLLLETQLRSTWCCVRRANRCISWHYGHCRRCCYSSMPRSFPWACFLVLPLSGKQSYLCHVTR